MRTETDLNSVKATARSFLYLDFNETTFSPMIIKHPFTDSGYICLPQSESVQPINILENEKALEKWRNFMRERIDECSSVFQIYMLITKPYKFAFIKYTSNFMSKDDLSAILADAWISTEEPNLDSNLSKTKLLSLFKSANPKALMDDEELAIFNNLDDTVTVYRGVTSYNADNIKALSWTLDYNKAEWFANRFGEEGGTVYEAEIDKKHILAYFGRRNESEVIVDPKYLIDIEEAQSQDSGMAMI